MTHKHQEQTQTKRRLLAHVGDLSQIAGVERFTYDGGVQNGVQAARVRTNGGLDFTVLLSRGMDISHASYNGFPLAWISQTGAAHPHTFNETGRNWLRTFHGGLLTTCGLQNAGASNTDSGEDLGIHGRISHAPADDIGTKTEWTSDTEAEVSVTGTLREAIVFGENLRLTRRITAPVFGAELSIVDRVENLGWKTVPLMVLYHINFGWPLVSQHTEILTASPLPPVPRDADAERCIARWNRLEMPQEGYAEQCFFHDLPPDEAGQTQILLINRAEQIGVALSFDKANLPFCTEWKMMGQGEYVCGIEPGNCLVLGRRAERNAGRLQHIGGGEEKTFAWRLSVLDGAEAIAQAENRLSRLKAAAALMP